VPSKDEPASRGRRLTGWLRAERYRLPLAVVGLAASILGVLTATLDLHDRIFGGDGPEPKDPNVELVVDRSEGMCEIWAAGTSKFAAAVRQVDEILPGLAGTNIALRAFGGPCNEATERLADFGTDNADDIRAALTEQRVGGQADLARAIVDATGDFADLRRFPNDVTKRIVVVTGGDSCPGDALGEIRDRFRVLGRERRFALDFRFVGVAVPLDERMELAEISRELVGGDPLFADDEEQLAAALQSVVVTEPLLESIAAVRELVDASVEDLNAVADAIFDECDREGAEATLARARKTVDRTERPFDRLAEKHERPEFGELYEIARTNRGLQGEFLQRAEDALDLADREGCESREAVTNAVGEWNELVAAYNDGNDAMDEIVKEFQE